MEKRDTFTDSNSDRIRDLEVKLISVYNDLNGKLSEQKEKLEVEVVAAFNDFNKSRIETLEKRSSDIKEHRTAEKFEAFEEEHDSRLNQLTKVKRAWKRFLTSTTFHGIPKAASTDKLFIKLVWTIMILVSLTFGLITIFQTVEDFYQFDVITNVERINLKNVTFPAVTICTKDFYFSTHYNNQTLKSLYIFNESLRYFLRDLYFKEESLKADRFEYFKIPKSFGDCVRFNGYTEKDFETSESKTDSFSLTVLRQWQKYVSKNENFKYFPYIQMEVYVTDNYINSYLNIDPIRLEYKSEHHVSFVKAEIETKLGRPYKNCTGTNDKTYHQMNCIEKCINKEIRDKYNCSIPSYYRVNDLEPCGGELQNYEVNHFNTYPPSEYFENHVINIGNLTTEFLNTCEKGCSKECYSVLFNTQVISSKSTSDTKFTFSFSDFSTLNITQIPKMNVFSLISNIGGSLGLFIGISFLSFVELLEFFFDLVFIFLIV